MKAKTVVAGIGLIPLALAGSSVVAAQTVNASPPPVLTVPPPPVFVPVQPPAPPFDPKALPRQPYPKSNPGAWVTENDYPTAALRQELQGITGFRVTVGPDGFVTDCVITQSSGTPILDQATCQLVTRRARFYPGLDASGKETTGTYANRIRWIIPQDSEGEGGGRIAMTEHPVPGTSVISFVIGTDGHATDCQVISGPNPEAFLIYAMPCGMDARFPVYTDPAGNPVARTVRLTIGVSFPGKAAPPRKKRR